MYDKKIITIGVVLVQINDIIYISTLSTCGWIFKSYIFDLLTSTKHAGSGPLGVLLKSFRGTKYFVCLIKCENAS